MLKGTTELCPQLYNNVVDGHIKGKGVHLDVHGKQLALYIKVIENRPDINVPPKVHVFSNTMGLSGHSSVMFESGTWHFNLKVSGSFPVTRVLATSLKSKSTSIEMEVSLLDESDKSTTPIKLADYV